MKITDYTFEEKQQALDEAWEEMNPKVETDAERLKRIIQMQWDRYTVWDMGEKDLVWLMKQTERSLRLEKEIEQTRWDMAELATAEQKLREALKFYADENNHPVVMTEIEKDGGYKARQALDSSDN